MGDVLPVSVTVILPTRNEEEALGPTIDAIPRGWCKDLEIMIVDGNSSDRTREIALEKDIRVHLEPRKGYGRAYRTGFDVAKNDIIVTMDADCTYPAELVPELVKRLLDDDLDFITCDRLSLAEDGSMSGLHGFGNWVLSFTARMLFWYGIKTLKRACGCSANPCLIMKKCAPPTMACHSVRRSKSSPAATLAKRRPSKSPSPTGPVLVKQKFTPEATVGRT